MNTVLPHRDVSPTTLGYVRASVFLIWIVKVLPEPLPLLGELPSTMFTRHGVMRLLPQSAVELVAQAGVLRSFKVLVLGTLVLAMVGAGPYRPIACLSAVLLTFHEGLVRGFTFVNHQELALLYCVYVLAVSPAADGFAWPRRERAHSPAHDCSGALMVMAGLLLVPYAAIAAHRLAYSTPDIFLGNSLSYWLGSLSGLDPDGWQLGSWVLRHPGVLLVAKLGFVLTTVFELIAPLCLIFPRLRRLWLVVVIPFHVLSWLLFDIFFWENVLLMLLLLTDLPSMLGRGARTLRSAGTRLRPLRSNQAPT